MNGTLRIVTGALGLAGHTLPMLALAGELRTRGHEVVFCGQRRWRAEAERLGLAFRGGEREIAEPAAGAVPGPAAIARALLPVLDEVAPHAVVADGLTLAPALAAEVREIPRATLFPEVYPGHAPGLPPFSLGLSAPRTRLGSAAWRRANPLLGARLPSTRWLRGSLAALNAERAALGLPPRSGFDRPGDGLVLVATLPELEYPRRWPRDVHVTGPMVLDPAREATGPPPGDEPLVVVAPSTVKDPAARLARTALAALAGEPVRVLVSGGGSGRDLGPAPANATIADWIDYASVFPRAALVVCHGNHGTVARALLEGAPLLVSPALDDDAEHGARVAWAGAGLMVPRRLLSPPALRAAARRLLADPRFAERARAIAAGAAPGRGAARGADLVESLARDRRGKGA